LMRCQPSETGDFLWASAYQIPKVLYYTQLPHGESVRMNRAINITSPH
jgi:hypothetical protein